MATEFLNQGYAAFLDERYEEAIECFSNAVKASAGATGYAARAQAHLKFGNYMEAAQDAGKAIELDPKMPAAYFRKGKALFYNEEYEQAKKCFQSGQHLDRENSNYQLWIRKCDAEIDEEDLSVEPIQQQPLEVKKEITSPVQSVAPAPSVSSPQTKYRHQWYQTPTHCCISLFAKRLPAEQLTVNFDVKYLQIQTRDETGATDFEFSIHLSEEIIPSQSAFEILTSKVEIKMKKTIDGRTWSTLSIDNPTSTLSGPQTQYPTSAKRQTDWNKVESDVKHEEESEKEEGDAAVQKLFQKIYADADDDTRRAMVKSFQESKGTCLSTDWGSVGSGTVHPASRD